MLLADLVGTSTAVAAASGRTEKTELLAELLARVPDDELEAAVAMLVGEPRQGRVGVGWATMADVGGGGAPRPQLTITDLDRTVTAVAAMTGAGSSARRRDALETLLARATRPEADFVSRLLVGELRQGALAGVMTNAIARAAEVPATAVRRAVMLTGDLGAVAVTARSGGRPALDRVGLEVLRPVQPMLAVTSASLEEAVDELGTVSVEWKLDGIRVQVHRTGDDVGIFTRNLHDVTARLPELRAMARALPADRFVLDGETIGGDIEGPDRFQDTASSFSRQGGRSRPMLDVRFFDLLHLDGHDLLDEPLTRRRAALEQLVGDRIVPGRITDSSTDAAAVLAEALDRGHEGVMVKDADSPYHAGRRGKNWRKVKPVHTLDLMVLAVERGHGRRAGWLSNLHLGARGPEGPVMVGKTFKGLTDELLRWQTEELGRRAIDDDGHVVTVRPDLVVEVAVDGVQRSSRYAGGVALRFARVRRYRPDRSGADADTIDTVRSLLDHG